MSPTDIYDLSQIYGCAVLPDIQVLKWIIGLEN